MRDRAPIGRRITRILDRPATLMLVVPLGAVYVGGVQWQQSRGFTGTAGLIGFVGVTLFYLAQTIALLVDPRWVRSAWAGIILACAPYASVTYRFFLVDSLVPAFWAWLIAPVMMITTYVCRTRDVVVVGLFVYGAGFSFFWQSGIDPRSNYGLVTILVVLWGLPAWLTRLVLGRSREVQLTLIEQQGRDGLTNALNRRGLETGLEDLRSRLARQDPDALLSVLVLELDGVKQIGERLGNTAVQEVLSRVADVLQRAYRRDSLVSRISGRTFAVVTTHDAEAVAEVLLGDVDRAVRRATASARIGGVRDLPLDGLGPEWLGSVLAAAQGEAGRAARRGERISIVRGDAVDLVPGPPPPPPVEPIVPDIPHASTDSDMSPRRFGIGASAVAVLVVAVPSSGSSGTTEHLALVGLSAALAMVGVFVSVRWIGGAVVHLVTTACALAAAALSVTLTDDPYAAFVALTVLPFPVYLAALTLPVGTATAMAFLLPVASLAVLYRGPFQPATAEPAFVAIMGFALVTTAMALWVRRQRDLVTRRLFRATLLDPGTGLLSREGLLQHYRGIPHGDELAVLYLDIDSMAALNADFGHHGGDNVLRHVAGHLVEAVGETGAAGRVGGDEFVLLLPGAGRAGPVVRRITELLAADEVPVTVTIGQAFGTADGEAAFWHLVEHADEALILNRARSRRRGSVTERRATPRSLGLVTGSAAPAGPGGTAATGEREVH